MTTNVEDDARANLVGSGWMITAMAAFAIEDALIKFAALTLPLGQILIIFGLGGALVFAGLARRKGQALFMRDVLSRPMCIRVVFEVTGRLFYTIAITLIPLSTATVILQATPLVVVAGAAFIFGETVGWRRWTAIGIGLIGVLIIVQPGTDGFTMLSLTAVIGMVGFAGRDLASRVAPATMSTELLGFYGFLSMTLAGGLYLMWQPEPMVNLNGLAIASLLATIAVGTTAYACLMKAMRTGNVSAVTPFRYTRLLFGLALGVLVFGEGVSAATIAGSGLIVLSGVFILWRGKAAAPSTVRPDSCS